MTLTNYHDAEIQMALQSVERSLAELREAAKAYSEKVRPSAAATAAYQQFAVELRVLRTQIGTAEAAFRKRVHG